ncbi:single-stranded-DNA-specific exonuclease RecJ [Thioflexithrix psekupsensis]|uniref:Single-stranded-DNA-specific exonuclease RecJ n=1 Tax=Thioflexithrix psekupsensis TaxID=1570016 RepID=A0A251X590_9GAMM|nr:single-stranded-DNA-specific exonuclease RecJ [Thioflexithrix psekupsensis]OUD12591.1 single-stranded-DNA-specific exonuclease RecJ [Thioflexithrix psekupsensis]
MPKIIHRRAVQYDAHYLPELHPVLRRILAARSIQSLDELTAKLDDLLPLSDFKNLDTAVELLTTALMEQQRIMIVADYDADGATSCVVAYRALQAFGALHLSYVVPNREKQGYGLTPAIVAQIRPWQPDLLITVDNGIASFSGVIAAKKAGIKVLITDHHLPAAQLPQADAIINPNVADNLFPSKHLAGVGVIFYLMLALRRHLRTINWFQDQAIREPNLAELLDIVALGTVADMVTLDHNNRILVEQGLRRIRANQCCAGIRALIKVSHRSQEEMMTRDLGFSLAPKLNAAGRMDDMSHGIQCLLCDEENNALEYATRLDQFNQERQFIEAEMLQQALAQLNALSLNAESCTQLGVCLLDTDWHPGVIGLLASRIKERLHRPVIVFTQAEQEGFLKGSGRSIQRVHIRDILVSIEANYPELICYFGGHAMAAGLTIPEAAFPQFQQVFDQKVRELINFHQLDNMIYSDGELSDDDFTLELAEALRAIPWGQGFEEPIFDGAFELIHYQVLKEKHLKLQLRPLNGQKTLTALAFNNRIDTVWPSGTKQLYLAYRLAVNSFRNKTELQLMIESISVLPNRVES